MEKKKYVTTPIYYVNGDPHIGHAHTSVMADILKRMMVRFTDDVFLSTGVDEHGQKNEAEIRRLSMTPSDFLDAQGKKFRDLFDSLNVSCDIFVRTSRDEHRRTVSEVLRRLYEDGLIVEKTYTGLYCSGCEQFKTDQDLDEKGRCPDHLTVPVKETEQNYFFKLEPYRLWLKEYILTHSGWIKPEIYKNKILDMLSEPLEDLCVSRPKSRVTLGIELPFDTDYITYVWFDALLNYISSIGWAEDSEDFSERWNNSAHLMAKDIIKTHCIYWPIMLKAIGLKPAACNLVHGFWVGGDGRKMSKSLGNGVNPKVIIDKYGSECLRFFLALRLGRNESRISYELIDEFYNSVMVNLLGNTYLRTVKLIEKFTYNRIPEVAVIRPEDNQFLNRMAGLARETLSLDPDLEFIQFVTLKIDEIARGINRYIDETAPWKLSDKKGGDEALSSILRVCVEAVRILFEAAYPIIPVTSEKVIFLLGLEIEPGYWKDFQILTLKLISGKELQEARMLFPRIQ